MTYALAWKSKKEVFLAADTAITSSSDVPLNLELEMSSFGQTHFIDESHKKKVEERATKLFLKNNIGITFAGNYELAIEVVSTFYKKISSGVGINDALKDALFLHSVDSVDKLQLIIGYYEGNPKLLSFNADYDLKIKEEFGVVQIGAPLKDHRQLTESWIKDFVSESNPNLQLVDVLSILQSYNLFSPQMSRGIGGAFCGLYVGNNCQSWQPDILYADYGIDDGKIIGTCFRHDCFAINSPTIGASRCFTTQTSDVSVSFMEQQAQKAVEKSKRLQRDLEFQYVVIVNVELLSITIIEMNRHSKHEFIWLQRVTDELRQGVKIIFFNEILPVIKRSTSGVVIIPYKKPRVDQRVPLK